MGLDLPACKETVRRGTFVLCDVLGALPVFGAPFRNLSFEEAITNSIAPIPFMPPSSGFATGPTADLSPVWQTFRGTNLLGTTGFNLNEPIRWLQRKEFFLELKLRPLIAPAPDRNPNCNPNRNRCRFCASRITSMITIKRTATSPFQ